MFQNSTESSGSELHSSWNIENKKEIAVPLTQLICKEEGKCINDNF